MPLDHLLLDRLLRRQAGVVAVRQAAAHGVSPRTLQRWAAERGWERLHPGVYLAAGHRRTDEVRLRAAWLWAGEQSTVSGRAAAFWHGMAPAAPAVVEITVAARTKPRPQPGLRLVRRDLSRLDRVGLRGIRLTAHALTVLETAATSADGSAFLDRAPQRHVSFTALYQAYCRNLGRPASRTAYRLLVAAADGADSAAERLLVGLLRGAGIGGWVLGHPFAAYRIDLAFVAARVAVEVDGWAWHSDVDRFRADRRKGNALVAAGWDLLRFTWHDLTTEPHRVLAEITHALGRGLVIIEAGT